MNDWDTATIPTPTPTPTPTVIPSPGVNKTFRECAQHFYTFLATDDGYFVPREM